LAAWKAQLDARTRGNLAPEVVLMRKSDESGWVQPHMLTTRRGGKYAKAVLGEALKGEELEHAIANQKTGHKTTSLTAVQRLWNASPLVDPRTGLYYPAGIVSSPTTDQDGTSRALGGPESIPGSLATGGIVNIKVGTREGGEFNRRVAVAGGRAVIGRFGNYHQISVVTEKVNSIANPVVFSWITGEPPGRSDDLWESPAYSDDGTGGKKFLPEGAVQVYSDTATTFRFASKVDGTERSLDISGGAGELVFVPNQASWFATSGAAVVWFRLAPL